MFKLFRICSLLFFVFSMTFVAFAQNEDEMKVWQEYMTPGKMHEWMAKSVGDWTSESKMWMAPGAEPVVSKGTMNVEMMLGGRYMKQTHKGEMMGMPFEGINLVAYDNAKQVFISTWMDNMGTGVMTCEGKLDEATKTLTMTGAYFDPMTKSNKPFREVLNFSSDDKHTMEMYVTEGDKEFKNMEITFTKK